MASTFKQFFPLNRQMGLTLGLIGLWATYHWRDHYPYVFISATFSLIFIVAAIFKPSLFAHITKLWMGFSSILEKVMGPIIMLVIYGTVIVPIGLLCRALGHDSLGLTRDKTARSYWKKAPSRPINFDTMY